MPYLRNYTIYSDKISYLFLSITFDPTYGVLEKSEHFLNFRHKWVKHIIFDNLKNINSKMNEKYLHHLKSMKKSRLLDIVPQ